MGLRCGGGATGSSRRGAAGGTPGLVPVCQRSCGLAWGGWFGNRPVPHRFLCLLFSVLLQRKN